jgi:hypothetical protein
VQDSKFCELEPARLVKHDAYGVRDCGCMLFRDVNMYDSREFHINSSHHRILAIVNSMLISSRLKLTWMILTEVGNGVY